MAPKSGRQKRGQANNAMKVQLKLKFKAVPLKKQGMRLMICLRVLTVTIVVGHVHEVHDLDENARDDGAHAAGEAHKNPGNLNLAAMLTVAAVLNFVASVICPCVADVFRRLRGTLLAAEDRGCVELCWLLM
jgi:hypothetical protein